MKKAPSILIIDSGIGGLCISQAIQRRLPTLVQHYCLDLAFFPYGTKTEAQIQQRLIALIHDFLRFCTPDLVVIACNTASTTALPTLRTHFSMPFVGVVPAIKPAYAVSQSKKIALLATQGTINRPYIDTLIHACTSHALADNSSSPIIRIACNDLVQLAEHKMAGNTLAADDLKACLSPLFQHPDFDTIDTAILGCTHFPLLKTELSALFPPHWQWIDSGDAIAKRVDHLLSSLTPQPHSSTDNNSDNSPDNTPAKLNAYSTQKSMPYHQHLQQLGFSVHERTVLA